MALRQVLRALTLFALAGSACAQANLSRVEVTGSSIRRVEAEGALPTQVITRAELDRQGIASAEQLVMWLTSTGTGLDNLASNADVVSGAQRGNNGASSANLRGQGANATLVLLNGRRLAAHGLNGGVVDLNQIPMAVVERIEVLKDGASAIYGTDAIGGVINFIVGHRMQGVRAASFADLTQAGGGRILRQELSGAWGDLDANGRRLIASVSLSDHQALRGDQRDFVNTFQPQRGLSVDTRGSPFATLFPLAGTAIPSASAAPYIPGTGVRASGGINLLDLPGAPGCDALGGQGPYDERLWNAPGSALACAWDTGRAAVLQQPVRNLNGLARAVVRLGAHQVNAEVMAGRSESAKRFSPIQLVPNSTTQNFFFPRNEASVEVYDRVFDQLLAHFPELAGQRGLPLGFRWRCLECGAREIQTTSQTARTVLSLEGPVLSQWEYRLGWMHASSEAASVLGSGYYFRGTTASGAPDGPGLIPALSSGRINVFLMPGESQGAAGLAALDSASARGTRLYGGRFSLMQVDASASGPLFRLPGGTAMGALGLEQRRESYRFQGDSRAASQRPFILGAPFDDVNALAGVRRGIGALYAELMLPWNRGLEATVALRSDVYEGFGRTTHPKVSALWRPMGNLLLRGAFSTGFRVPTFNQVHNGTTESPYSGADLADPARCPSGVVDSNKAGCEPIRPTVLSGGKADLGPERARMASVGLVWEPHSNWSLGLDWWRVDRLGTIEVLGVQTLLRHAASFPERLLRAPDGSLIAVDNRWANTGQTHTQGIELSVQGGWRADGARWSFGLDGNYLLKKRSRLLVNGPWGDSEIGRFSFAGDLGLRWKHNAFVTWKREALSVTLSQVVRSGYQNLALPGVASGAVLPADWSPRVASYSTLHASLSYQVRRDLTLTVGIKNLLDTDPPFAINYDSNSGSGSSWEPRVADPRGRAYTVRLEYRFL